MSSILINTNKEQLDLPFIHQFLSQAYWGKDRTMEEVITAVEHSLNFGIYKNGQQIGYARVVTDYIQFAYIMDVFIVEDQRGQGYSKQLMQYMFELEVLKNVKMWRLATSDAHGLYQHFGFTGLAKPENMMERASKQKYKPEIIMEKIQLAVSVFNKNAQLYQDKYIDLVLYDDTYDYFCTQIKKQNASILDIACGPGNISRFLLGKRPDFKISGIDLAPAMLELAQKNCPSATFRIMDCRDISSLDIRFDGIVCGFGLPYLSQEDAAKLIKDSFTLLQPGGILYLSTMEDDYTKSGPQTSASSGDTLFLYYHEKDFLLQALLACGFTVLSVQNKNFVVPGSPASTDLILVARK